MSGKKDVALRANGYWVLKAASGASDTVPNMQTLEELQARARHQLRRCVGALDHQVTRCARAVRVAPVNTPVWWQPALADPEDGSSFDPTNLGQWVPTRELNSATGLECAGMLRPAFEVQLEKKPH
jgi:hypothetical protein